MRTRIMAVTFLAAALLTFPGCGSRTDGNADDSIAVLEHNAVSLHNYRIAREFSAAGRFELAREHYLLAYAAAEGDGMLRERLHQELEAVVLMIKTLR